MKCCLCGKVTKNKNHICNSCQAHISLRPLYECKICHKKLENNVGICGFCRKHKYHFDWLYNLGYYKMALGDFIIKIKFKENIYLARYLGQLLGDKLKDSGKQFDMIIPVPTSIKRFHERGFDQALEIAKGVRKVLKIPIKNNTIKKRDVPPLENMKREERFKIMKNAFYIEKGGEILTNKHILIIDDVFTTGATTDAMSKIIRRLNPIYISVGVLAR